MKTIFAAVSAVAVLLSGCASAPAPAPSRNFNADKMNLIEPGMSTQQVMQVLGGPSSSNNHISGFRCAEYQLQENRPGGYLEDYFVILYQGRVIESGKGSCRFKLDDDLFAPKTSYSAGGKYWQFLNPQK